MAAGGWADREKVETKSGAAQKINELRAVIAEHATQRRRNLKGTTAINKVFYSR
jgi:hypothetical protein